MRVARILALWRIGKEEIFAGAQAAAFEDGAQHVSTGSGIRRGFKYDQLSALKMRSDRFGGLNDERQIRLALTRKRRRHAQDDGIDFGEPRKIAGCSETT